VTVNLSGAAAFASWAQFLQFDNTKLQLTSQAAGSFSTFVQDARTLATINSTGEVHAGGFGLSNNAGGSGTLGVFTFTAIAAGATQITTQDKSATFAFGDVLSNASSVNVLPTIAGPLALTIGSGITKPAITSTLTATGTVGSAFSYTITAGNSPTSFNATGLPAGLSINTTSGVISGTPTAAGTSNVTISASNSAGTGSATLVLTINAITSPTIALTSSTSTPTVGNTFTVTVNLSGAAPFASWAQFLQFDKTKVQLTAQATGTFNTFVQDSRTLATINANGEVHAGGFGFANNAGGSGTLGVFTFKAIAAGSTQITTQDKSATFVFGDVLSDASSANVLPTIAGPLALTIGSNNHAPVIASAASATPNPAVVGQIVAFTVGASDPDGDTLSYAWNFGDGSNGSGASSSHAYAAAGTYSAKVTASDPGGLSVTSTVSVAVSTSSGGSGGSGSGGAGGSGTLPLAMSVSKIQGSVNFKADGHDAVSISGALPGVASPFTPAGTVLNLNVSGATATFTLDAHGKSRVGSASIAFKLKPTKHKKGNFNGGNLAFVAKLQHGTWSSLWNMNNNATNAPTPMSAIVQMNGNTYMTTVTVNYSGKSNQGGKFKK
jgi:PKD repeat protein